MIFSKFFRQMPMMKAFGFIRMLGLIWQILIKEFPKNMNFTKKEMAFMFSFFREKQKLVILNFPKETDLELRIPTISLLKHWKNPKFY